MFLLQITQAPFILYVADAKGQPTFQVHVPTYTLEEAIEYGAELFAQWREEQQQNMTEAQKRDFDAMYPTAQATIADIKRAIASLDGAKEVISKAFPRAKVYKAVRHERRRKAPAKDNTAPPAAAPTIVWKKGEEVPNPDLDAMLKQVLTGNGSGTLCRIAWEIANLEDHSTKLPPEIKVPKDPNSDDEEEEDPLP